MSGSTPRLNLFQPDENVSMTLVDQNLNNNWTKVEAIDAIATIPTLLTLPSAPSYIVGDQVYMADMRADGEGFLTSGGAYICVDNSSTIWGTMWRPLSRVATPWKDVPSSAFNVNFITEPTAPLQWRITSRAVFEFRGAAKVAGGGTFSPAAYGSNILLDEDIPSNIESATFYSRYVPITSLDSNNVNRNVIGRINLDLSTRNIVAEWWNNGSTTEASQIWLDCVNWQMGRTW